MKISQVPAQVLFGDFSISDFKVISGGQNGADQAGLRAAQSLSVSTGGWAPAGWKTLDGQQMILLRGFGLTQAPVGYAARTAMNVQDSDVTFRFAVDWASTGEKCTYHAIKKYQRPFLDFDVLTDLTDGNARKAAEYLISAGHKTLNIAGNSEKTAPGIGKKVETFLILVFTHLKNYDV